MSSNGTVVAGSRVEYDGVQIRTATLHGVSNGARANEYRYDLRGRLLTSSFAREAGAAVSVEHVDAADFRHALARPAGELPSLTFEREPGHKIASMTRGTEPPRVFDYAGGAERVSDGRFVYEFDARGRLIQATELPNAAAPQTALRRILYDYSASGRLVGRRAEYSVGAGEWALEDRADVLAEDALPADTTFVWDPISDQLVSIYTAGGATLVRQVIHGGNAYDDPIEIATAEGRLYPIFDEAATGNLQVVLNEQGELLSRELMEGAYGEDEFNLAGAAVDRIALTAQKDATGNLASVEITVRTTDALDPATVATGARLAVVHPDTGAVVRSASAVPSLIDNDTEAATLRWTLTGAEWNALVGGGTPEPLALSIAVTSTLRATAWGPDTPILPAPAPLHTSTPLPAELRELLPALTTWLATLPPTTPHTTTLYQARSLSTVARKGAGTAGRVVGARFQGLPFGEGGTGLVYMRARWYDPRAGAFLSPDPMGYGDSSNIYALCGADPINRRDPTGEDAYDDKLQGYIRWYISQQDMMDREYKRLQRAYKRAVATNNDVGLIVADINIIERERLFFGGNVDNAATYTEYARSRGDARVLRMSYEEIYAQVVSDEMVRAVGAAVVGAFMPHAPEVAANSRSIRGRLANAYNNSVLSSETGAVGPNVKNAPKAERQGPGKFVPKNESMRPTASQYQDDVGEGVPGHAYRVPYTNPNPRGKPHVDFDGVQGTFPVDAKLSVVTRPKTVSQAIRQATALRETGSRGIWKVPSISEALRARRVIADANAGDVISVVVERRR